MQRNGGKYRKYLTPRNVMNLVIGSMGVVLTLAASLTGSLTIVAGLKKSRERLRAVGAKYAWVAFAGMAISTFAMQRALITRDFSIKYVAEQGSSLTPPLYNVATMWSALEGSILLWGLVLAGYLAIVAKKFSNISIKTFPAIGTLDYIFYRFFKKIQWTSILDLIDYKKILHSIFLNQTTAIKDIHISITNQYLQDFIRDIFCLKNLILINENYIYQLLLQMNN